MTHNAPGTETIGRRFRTRRLAVAAILVATGGIAAMAWSLSRTVELPDGVSYEEYEQAQRRFRKMYHRTPERLDVLSLLGELAVRDDRPETAVACFREIPNSHPRYGPAARLQEAQVLLRLNRAVEAERKFRGFLELAESARSVSPRDVDVAYKWLGYILSVELRLEERKALLAEVHARGRADVYDSKQYYFPHLLIWHSARGRHRLTEFLKQNPENRQLRIALGRYRTMNGRLDQALAVLEELHRQFPDDRRCVAALLECHFERDDREAFAEVAQSLPRYEAGEPWLLTRMRGEWARREERWEVAARHFQHALDAEPAYLPCCMGLAEAYGELRGPEARREMLQKARVLAEIRVNLRNVTEEDHEPALKLAANCEKIGLPEAAETFRKHAGRIQRNERRGSTSAAMPR